jgi:phospholipid/cholesterol/gamma-HCH transport system permease protein
LGQHIRWKTGAEGLILEAHGLWDTDFAMQMTNELREWVGNADIGTRLKLDLQHVESFDTFGVISLLRFIKALENKGIKLEVINLEAKYAVLVAYIREGLKFEPVQLPKQPFFEKAKERLTMLWRDLSKDFLALLDIIGESMIASYRIMKGYSRFHFQTLVKQIDAIAFRAVPIVILITFLIGAIIAQQGIFHFRSFGADIFVVDMVGVLTLREIGVLIVSIMIAGRTGSAYTAELGSMKMREEVDALRVMGLDPVELLVLPRLLAMIIGLPILTIIGDFSALFGGALVSNLYGGISFATFFDRFQEVVSVRHLWVGLAKAPFMAAVIGLIACVEGMRVQGSAESLGKQTTASVVKSIFMVIVLDGIFAMFFAAMGI